MRHLSDILREARRSSGLSQLELALRLGFSQRHVSFVETKRAHASRRLLEAWLEEVNAPPSIRNAAMLHAGYAHGTVGAEPEPFTKIDGASHLSLLNQLLSAHEPLCGFVFDADWHIVEMNSGCRWLCELLMPRFLAKGAGHARGLDMVAACTDPDGLYSRMRSPGAPARALLEQLRLEAWARPSLLPRIGALSRAIDDRFAPAREPGAEVNADCNFTFDSQVGVLRFFRFQSVFGLPQDVTSSSLRVELWFPTDPHTREMMVERPRGLPLG